MNVPLAPSSFYPLLFANLALQTFGPKRQSRTPVSGADSFHSLLQTPC